MTWNKESFSRLVIPGDTKELIQAAITSHGHDPSAAPDIISDKGQGLLILLHGGPGTGKTLTAESIAEEQERPLYRVTCGDIGVEPVEVEKVSKTPEYRHTSDFEELTSWSISNPCLSSGRHGVAVRIESNIGQLFSTDHMVQSYFWMKPTYSWRKEAQTIRSRTP